MSENIRPGITNGSRTAGDDVPGYFGICDSLVFAIFKRKKPRLSLMVIWSFPRHRRILSEVLTVNKLNCLNETLPSLDLQTVVRGLRSAV